MITLNLHSVPDLTTLYGLQALSADGTPCRVVPDRMGTGRPVLRHPDGHHEILRGALTIDTNNDRERGSYR